MSIPSVGLCAVLGVVLLPLWLPVAVAVDLVRGARRLPIARLLAFGVGWAWLETAGVAVAGALWATGRRRDQAAHYRLQRWWAASLMRVLERTTGLRVEIDPSVTAALRPGPVVVLCRHASLADSLVSAWVITTGARLHPRYVLKRELQLDPCLDLVGGRVPNHFLDRDATDSSVELASLRALSAGMGADDVAVIFPEGTRANPAKRTRALARIAERDPDRLASVEPLRHLLPVRPAGSASLVAGCPEADVVIAWHAGFEGFDTFGGILRNIGRGAPRVRFGAVRIARHDVPSEPVEFARWLDARWLDADACVDRLLAGSTPTVPTTR